MIKNEKKNAHKLQQNDVFFKISNSIIDVTFEQIVLNDLIVNEKYFNSVFFVKKIYEVFFDNIKNVFLIFMCFLMMSSFFNA